MIKSVGAGMAVLALGSLAKAEGSMPPGSKPADPVPSKPAMAPQPFTLPALAYAYDALEPHLDARTMEIHFTKHHQAYIDNANRCLAEYPDLLKLTAEALVKDLRVAPEKIRGLLRNNLGGHLNHSLFWGILSPKGARSPSNELATAIDTNFGSFDAFKERLLSSAATRFGSGWAWLSIAPDRRLVVHSTANQDSPLLEGLIPVLGIDVWEHAYYLKYQNLRVDYVKAVMQVLDWGAIGQHYAHALASLPKL